MWKTRIRVGRNRLRRMCGGMYDLTVGSEAGVGWLGLQSRANHLSASLDDLKKTLYERGRALGVKPKSAVPIEVSTGRFCD